MCNEHVTSTDFRRGFLWFCCVRAFLETQIEGFSSRLFFFSSLVQHIIDMPEAIANGSNGTLHDDSELDFTDIEEK